MRQRISQRTEYQLSFITLIREIKPLYFSSIITLPGIIY